MTLLRKTSRLLAGIFCGLSSLQHASGQTELDTLRQLEHVEVTADPAIISYARTVEPLTPERDKQVSALNLTDWLARIPGVTQFTTGAAIAKPVIRGLYGNRVLTLLNGLRFDAQQWQDEHGLGLSQIGVTSVSVRKTGSSAFYGTEAVGGTIDVQEEEAASGVRQLDATVRLRSSTLGTLSDVGYLNGRGKVRFHLRGGYESGADYADGNNVRVLNSRYTGYYLKAGAGWQKGSWRQYNRYSFSYNQYGFILEDLLQVFTPDSRWSRAMSGPHHNVTLHTLSNNNVISLSHGTLEVNLGGQSNQRAEDEGGGAISLNVHLLSGVQNAAWTRPLAHGWTLTLRENFLYQSNTNLGKRVLIPDARTSEAHGAVGLGKDWQNKWTVVGTLAGTTRSVHTLPTGAFNGAGSEVAPFSIRRNTANASLIARRLFRPGAGYVELVTGTGARAPNLAELSSAGVHEGTYRYEIGDDNLATEKSWTSELTCSTSAHSHLFALQASVFYNRFADYIFLAPTGEKKFGFDVHRYFQKNARLYGGEVGTVLRNEGLSLQWKETFACVFAEETGGMPLPYTPPPRLTSALYKYFKDGVRSRVRDAYLAPEMEYTFRQRRTAPGELASMGYALLNVYGGVTTTIRGRALDWTLAGRNLLDKRYASHLSRLRYYGIADPGINVVLSVHTWLRF